MAPASDFPSVLAAALALPSDERQTLVGRLTESLQHELRATLGEPAVAEVRERIARYRAGETKGWTLDEAAAEVERRRTP